MAKASSRSAALLNWVRLDRNETATLYEQIGRQIRDAILSGDLEPGVSLPSSRALSRDLGVSRITTLQAYEQLAAEGFLETRRGSGTRVAASLSTAHLTALVKSRELVTSPSADTQDHLLKLHQDESTNVAFQPGIPAFDAFPRQRWSRILARHALRDDQFLLDYAHIGGYAPLRLEIAKYLRSSRGVQCDPDQVIIVTSVRAAISAICSVMWERRSIVAVEDPGYGIARRVLAASGCRLQFIPVDDRGFRVADMLAKSERCVGAYVTPAHHWPTGTTMAADRRMQLLDWAVRSGAWIIEDDYDSEFRFDSPPLGTLHALGSGRVIYAGTFSKTLAPSIRTAYFVVPTDHQKDFERQVYLSATEPPLHIQAALSEFLAKGHFTLHIARMRKLYAQRRDLLVAALRKSFGNRIGIILPPGGLQIIVELPDHVEAAEVSRRAGAVDLVLRDLNRYYVNQSPPNWLHLGFAAIPEGQIEPAVRRLANAVSDIL